MVEKSEFRKPTAEQFARAAEQTRAQRYLRIQPSLSADEALNLLHTTLVSDAKLYESDQLQDQRDAVAHALLAVGDFLQSQGFSNLTFAPLMRPVAALAERENNALDLMFSERKRGGKPRKSLIDHERMGILAALTEGWLRTHENDGKSQDMKLAELARKMKGRWFGAVTKAQLKTARDLVAQEGPDHFAVMKARNFYARYVEVAEKFGAENAFPILAQMLNDLPLPFGAGEGGISKTPHVSPSEDP